MEAKKLSQLIKVIASNATKQRDQIQAALVGCALQAYHGNPNYARDLFGAVGTGVRVKAMSHWLSLNAPIYFKNGVAEIATERRKEIANSVTLEQFAADLAAQPAWYEHGKQDTVPTNIWDSASFIKKVDEYMLDAIKKANKNDATTAEALDKAHSAFRSELARHIKVVEA